MAHVVHEAVQAGQATQDAAFQLRLEDALRELADPQAVAQAGCAVIGAELGVARVWLELFSPDVACAAAWPDPAPAGGLALAALGGRIGAELSAGRAAWGVDVRLEPDFAAGAVQRALSDRGIISLACVPVLQGGLLAAVLAAADVRPRPWPREAIAGLRQAAARIVAARKRAAEMAELRRREAEYRLGLALCPQMFWTATPDGLVDEGSPLFGQLARQRPDQRGHGWRETTDPEDRNAFERAIALCGETGCALDIEHRTIDPDGRTRWVHTLGRPMRGPDGSIMRWFGTITDIDRRRRAEAALRASEDRFLRAIAGARVGTWDWDMAQDDLATSPGYALQFHDLPEGSLRSSKDLLAAIHPDDRDRVARLFADVRERARDEGSAEYEAEYRVIRRDGEVRWLGALGTATGGPQGSLNPGGSAGGGTGGHLSGMTVDMSERRRAEEMLTATQDRLRALNTDLEATVRREVALRERTQALLTQAQRMEALGQLAGGIAHDFNNVLQAVMGGLDLLERQAERPDQVRRLAARVGEAAWRGVAITGRLLAFARRSDLQAEAVDVVPLLEGLRDLLAPTLQIGISMQVFAGPGLPRLRADRAQLETALVNLAVNARDAMPEGGLITIGAEAVDDTMPGAPPGLSAGQYLCIAVRDMGTGMSAEVLARASEPFFTTKPVGQGTGLGLAMVRGFTEQSGGGLVLSSLLGHGTTVRLWFPVAYGQDNEAAEGAAIVPLTRRLPGCVMVVDDDDLVRSTLSSQIEALGSLVIEARNGDEAIALYAGGARMDAVITDYAMPGMNGSAFAAKLRELHPGMPILMVTGHVDGLQVDMLVQDPAGFALLRKPISTDALEAALAGLMP